MGVGLRNEDGEEDFLALLGVETVEEGADGAAHVLLFVAIDCGDADAHFDVIRLC